MVKRLITFTDALKESLVVSMQQDPNIYVCGLGVTYKNGGGGSTAGLVDMFPGRVFDTPNSEASITGACVGAALNGLRPVILHDRVEFALFAADAILTQASKWCYSFGGESTVPAVFRITLGRQWGTGPQHSQSLYSLFGNTTGLKAVIPSTPRNAKGLIMSALRDNNPVVVLESLWLRGVKQHVDEGDCFVSLNKAQIYKQGSDVTVVSYGDGFIETLQANKILEENNINAELIDLVSLNPIDYSTIIDSVKKTGKLVCIDTTNEAFCIGSEIISKICTKAFSHLKEQPILISAPNVPVPTSHKLTEFYYPNKVTIANKILNSFKLSGVNKPLSFDELNFGPKIEIE